MIRQHNRRSPGARTPLLDRLRDNDPESRVEVHPARVHTLEDVRRSVAVELHRLLNTRVPLAVDEVLPAERSVIDYGLPDFSHLNSASERDRQRLAALISRTVAAFEPRLRHPAAEVLPDETNPRALRVALNAELILDSIPWPVSFPLMIEGRGSEVIVGDF